MKASELRIGNYVYFHGDVEEINMVDGFGIIGREEQPLCSIDEFEPIPLTEEWLLRFGFVFKTMGISGAVCTRHSGHWYKNNNPYFAGTKNPFDIFLQYGQGVDIGSVHQLQNLFFALTGEELTSE